MLSRLLSPYTSQRKEIKSLLKLFWIYALTGAMLGLLTQVFLYDVFKSIIFNIVGAVILYTGLAFGFVVCGYLSAKWQINSKHGFSASFAVMSMAAVLFSKVNSYESALIALLLSGIGQGLFWLTIHTFEIIETKDDERDTYSSLLTAGTILANLCGPAIATLLLYIGNTYTQDHPYTLLFITSALVYALGFTYFSTISNYTPNRIAKGSVKRFLKDSRNISVQLYMFGNSLMLAVATTMLPLITLYLVGSALHTGIFSTITAFLSTTCILTLIPYRNNKNRLSLFGISSFIFVIVTLYFMNYFSFVSLVIFSGISAILQPIYRVSGHVIDLQTIESFGSAKNDFYSTMLLRDTSLYFGRILALLILYVITILCKTTHGVFESSIGLLAIAFVISYYGAHFLMKKHGELAANEPSLP